MQEEGRVTGVVARMPEGEVRFDDDLVIGADGRRSTLRLAAGLQVQDLAGRLEQELSDWDAIKLLSVSVDRLRTWWKPGLLCIGDAAHAMSPIGGVGINLAIQDAVAAANILAATLADRSAGAEAITPLLAKVQSRRMLATRIIQAGQVAAQNNLIKPVLESTQAPKMPAILQLFNRFPLLRVIPAYVVGVGIRPEHVHSPKMGA